MCQSVPNVQAGATATARSGTTNPLIFASPSAAPGAPAVLQQQVMDQLAARTDEAIALLVSMPFCAVHCLCCDRDVRAGQPEAVMQTYARHLGQEIQQLGEQIGGSRELMQLHLGGGSANLFSASSLVGLMQSLRQQ